MIIQKYKSNGVNNTMEARQGDMRVKDEFGNEWIPGTQVYGYVILHFRERTVRGDLQFVSKQVMCLKKSKSSTGLLLLL